MQPNCSGLKEGEVKISADSCNFHKDVWVKQRKTVLFISNTEVENKFQKVNQCGESARLETRIFFHSPEAKC